VLMANIYALARRWGDAERVRGLIKWQSLKKEPGRCTFQLGGEVVHVYVNDQRAMFAAARQELDKMQEKLKAAGWKPKVEWATRKDGTVEEHEEHLCGHSEKIAIAHLLLRTPADQDIRIVKNLRVCGDCHEATKAISKLTGRRMIIRDANAMHVYERGMCSCGDKF
jgi:hypothetical protein